MPSRPPSYESGVSNATCHVARAPARASERTAPRRRRRRRARAVLRGIGVNRSPQYTSTPLAAAHATARSSTSHATTRASGRSVINVLATAPVPVQRSIADPVAGRRSTARRASNSLWKRGTRDARIDWISRPQNVTLPVIQASGSPVGDARPANRAAVTGRPGEQLVRLFLRGDETRGPQQLGERLGVTRHRHVRDYFAARKRSTRRARGRGARPGVPHSASILPFRVRLGSCYHGRLSFATRHAGGSRAQRSGGRTAIG